MKSSLALLATAAAVSATVTSTEWVVDVVTVTVTAEPSDLKPEPTTTQAPPPPPTSTTEPEPVQTQIQAPEPQPETTTTQQQTAQPTSETVAPSGGYQGTAIDYHNAYRKDHSAGNLEWDATLAQYAENTAKKCVFAHDMDQGGSYGQNLASVGSSGDLGTQEAAVGKAIAEQWYQKEVGYYNFFGQSDPPPGADFSKFGHFSQLVWKDSQKAGCATVECPAGTVLPLASYFTVCNYSPPGNFGGKYAANVLPSLGLKINLST
ncbi:hypothetical protein LLEC1_03072 [Akanthomyces lecanii]|uniref:SCP domain-containing protein n=1 Tax=Cordyceps confragosa TaxID=2714763 RepID=A0A179I665_CORDF|nr:hypothetical protein LLEC1_03072 [Akanthomyces lecanii]